MDYSWIVNFILDTGYKHFLLFYILKLLGVGESKQLSCLIDSCHIPLPHPATIAIVLELNQVTAPGWTETQIRGHYWFLQAWGLAGL
jgi:hypothetical protein